MPGRMLMLFLDIIGRVAGNGNTGNIVGARTPPPKWGIILHRGAHLAGNKTQWRRGRMVVVVVVVVVELVFPNNNYCWQS